MPIPDPKDRHGIPGLGLGPAERAALDQIVRNATDRARDHLQDLIDRTTDAPVESPAPPPVSDGEGERLAPDDLQAAFDELARDVDRWCAHWLRMATACHETPGEMRECIARAAAYAQVLERITALRQALPSKEAPAD